MCHARPLVPVSLSAHGECSLWRNTGTGPLGRCSPSKSPPVLPPSYFEGVSCATPTICVAVGACFTHQHLLHVGGAVEWFHLADRSDSEP